MFLTRPAWFAMMCVGVWLVQLVLIAVAFHWIGSIGPWGQLGWEFATAGATVSLGVMLLVQLPRALQWRLRRNPRPNAEVIAERRRIARDLHDNLGSQLVLALVLLDPSKENERKIYTALEKCMLDLRLIVDNIDGTDAPLEYRLARLRYRMEPALAQRGIRMVWDIQTLRPAKFSHLDAPTHLLAIVQEALSNALQHSKATEIIVSVRNADESDSWCVDISDNGVGIQNREDNDSTACAGSGSGMAGMAQRARLAGGELMVIPLPTGGTCIRAIVRVTEPVT